MMHATGPMITKTREEKKKHRTLFVAGRESVGMLKSDKVKQSA